MAARDAKFYGKNACLALFEHRPDDVRRVFVSEEVAHQIGDVLRELARRRLPYRIVDDEELAKVSGTQHHEGICFHARALPTPDEHALLAPFRTGARSAASEGRPTDATARSAGAEVGRRHERSGQNDRAGCVIYLDGVENPHNVGAILRTAAHFGCVAIAGSRESLPTPSGATARVAEGGAEHVPFLRWSDPLASLRSLSASFALVATAHDAADALYQAALPRRCVFLLGAEGHGLSREVRELASMTIAIPGTGAVESLNVSSAAAILLGEHWRRFGP